MRTVVLQSFRTTDVPAWITRCLDSVRSWSEAAGYDYEFMDDSIKAFCGEEYLARIGPNIGAIINLARLEFARDAFRRGYDQAIWFDADVLIFAPRRLAIPPVSRCAFSKEIWVEFTYGWCHSWRVINNSVCAFAKDDPDLDFLIAATRHIAHHHDVKMSLEVGTWLLTGLERSLKFQLLPGTACFSPAMVLAIAGEGRKIALRRHAWRFGGPAFAANLCLSQDVSQATMMTVVERLEATEGQVVNQYFGSRANRAYALCASLPGIYGSLRNRST